MRLNQTTVTMPDLDAGWSFYVALGLIPIVDSRPGYVRFRCPDGDSTFSLHQGEPSPDGTTIYFECDDLDEHVRALKANGVSFTSDPVDQPWLWRGAELFDPGGNRVLLYRAGENRLRPPWRLPADTEPATTRVEAFSRLDHVQLAIPKGGESHAREFYVDILGFDEVAKPEALAKQAGRGFEAAMFRCTLA